MITISNGGATRNGFIYARFGLVTGGKNRGPDGVSGPLSGRSLGGRDPGYIPRLKGRRSYAKLFLEGGREMAGVGIAQIGRHRHDGGIAVGQASSGFLHSFSL